MENSERAKYHFLICCHIGGSLFSYRVTAEILSLGETYTLNIFGLIKKREAMLSQILSYLSALNLETLKENYSPEGTPISEEAKTWVANLKREVNQTFGRLSYWYSTPLHKTKELADFEHWKKSEFLTLDEVVWLTVGLEPTKTLIDCIKPYNAFGNEQEMDHVAEYMSRHKEVIKRIINPNEMRIGIDLVSLCDWIKEVHLLVHPGFVTMLESKSTSAKTIVRATKSNESPEQLDGGEKASMAKLIAAMAIDAYGYDPKARRSDIPKEIQGIADRLGLGVSHDTIRKYLKTGAELVPDDWKPE